VNELDKKTRTMMGLLNKIHSTPSNGGERYYVGSVLSCKLTNS